MLDFACGLYLGFGHPAGTLRSWLRLTTGVPAALAEPPGAAELGRRLAGLTACEAGVVAPSTLHVFFDLIEALRPAHGTIYLGAEAYPVARWGVERAAARGARVRAVRHDDPDRLRALIRRARDAKPPLVVLDGVCVDRGAPTPLAAHAEIVEQRGGVLVVDDTQGLGLFGANPSAQKPWGSGGGGAAVWQGLEQHPSVLLASSLAKAFGAPIAALMGPRRYVSRYLRSSDLRVHSSPPSAAAIEAGRSALDLNEPEGEVRRLRLQRNIRVFRDGAAALGLEPRGGLFPVQSLSRVGPLDGQAAHAALDERGIRTVLRRGRRGRALTVIIRSTHRPSDIRRLLLALESCLVRPSLRAAAR
jgi:8-amino-7-oxononanoate synthase